MKRLALTIDDVPFGTDADSGGRLASRVNEILRGSHMRAAAFAIASRISPVTRHQLDVFVEGGHEIGNHGFAHFPLDLISLRQFRDDATKADEALRFWLGPRRYYRYPLLRTGNSRNKRDGARRVLTSLDYTPVWATIDPPDYMWASVHDTTLTQPYVCQCAKAVHRWCEHYHLLARRTMGRSVDHILVLHLSVMLPALLEQALPILALHGWTPISVEEALRDPIYGLSDKRVGLTGVSWIHQAHPETLDDRPDEALR